MEVKEKAAREGLRGREEIYGRLGRKMSERRIGERDKEEG
jgi:hypothetical protein